MKAGYLFFAFVLALGLPISGQSQNVFPSSGPVGIGTNAPAFPLHIAADSGGRETVGLVQLEFKGISFWSIQLNRISSTRTMFQLVSGSVIPLSLTNDGEMTLRSLRGTGNRMLFANPDGVIRSGPVPTTSGDNLGNHAATTTLNLHAHDVVNVNRLSFNDQPNFFQTSPSPFIYHNLPEGYRVGYRLLIGNGNIDPYYKVKIEGDAYATGVWISSDANLKSNLLPISDPIRKLLGLRGVTYDFRPDPATPAYRTAGLVAQEVRAVLPEAVRENSDGQLALNYDGAVALLVEALKEQQATIRKQQGRIDQLERRLSTLERATK